LVEGLSRSVLIARLVWSVLSALTAILVRTGLPPGSLPYILRDPSDYSIARREAAFGGGPAPRFIFGLSYWFGTALLLFLAIQGRRVAAVGGAILLLGFTLPAVILDSSFMTSPIYWVVGLLNVTAAALLIRMTLKARAGNESGGTNS
jgi:hypothetical protein